MITQYLISSTVEAIMYKYNIQRPLLAINVDSEDCDGPAALLAITVVSEDCDGPAGDQTLKCRIFCQEFSTQVVSHYVVLASGLSCSKL